MISGTSYECIDRTNLASAGYRRTLVFIMSRVSRLFCTWPFQRKIEVTDGTRLLQAATLFLIAASAILPASRRLDVMTSTTNIFRDDALINSHQPSRASLVPYLEAKIQHNDINQIVTFNFAPINHPSSACTPVGLCEEAVIYDKNEQILSSGELRSDRDAGSMRRCDSAPVNIADCR